MEKKTDILNGIVALSKDLSSLSSTFKLYYDTMEYSSPSSLEKTIVEYFELVLSKDQPHLIYNVNGGEGKNYKTMHIELLQKISNLSIEREFLHRTCISGHLNTWFIKKKCLKIETLRTLFLIRDQSLDILADTIQRLSQLKFRTIDLKSNFQSLIKAKRQYHVEKLIVLKFILQKYILINKLDWFKDINLCLFLTKITNISLSNIKE